ncbi:disks large-associated protein 1 isoform X2 [Dasypus novemcinctus]|uniref:disks large-associated protein 1 isoform X2 n=1 Tax=Dasypus novemcinctus TaxID=9361 RepID=UPI00265FA0A8|nr:disks large-associated protein 1 isoform X2 [Dasypus novemcinctus]XP_058133429.1 disks large-associated protein 1 isoform X2 [Dasypus novemcinctus]XP_058133430.1 disks large-associated protein 1 isoform X2 [Dasypus novemcinctus]XP_058133431.1 disks large-associated protein 1 isoform X2 [Dasypus novemcinctus]XP_058133432.1 disks large-associated protein 1 isoform X2 [Dasypus novemcinctus]XP_058133433.1 disks large-associated protein 1 isoform X2 [Dasypus novemcinctus]
MKGFSGSRSHHHGVTCEAACDSLSPHAEHKPYLLSAADPHPADHPYYTQRNSFQAECAGPFSDPLASSTFPRRHYASQQELKDALAAKANRLPANLLDQFERQLPLGRDGYHTLQYKRTAVEHRSDSPGRIRHLVHSVQKLFTKSHSLEGPSKGSVNGGKASPDDTQPGRYGKRSKSKERRAEPKARPSTSPGWWSSDDNLDGDVCLYHAPAGVMTMGRCPDRAASQYFVEAYNTISEQAVKASRGNSEVKCATCANLPLGLDAPLLKKSAWSSTLTVSRAREVYQKASVNVDQAVVKAESCQQERSCQYLQVPQDEWTGYTPRGKDDEIPCRRMRSGSYIKAMGDEDSGDSDTSPKPSPKVAARRESYLKATQPSLTELTTLKISNEHSPKLQIRSHSYLRAVSEVSINRSLDSLDPAGLLTSPKFRSRNESYMRAMSTISQVSEMEVNGQFESVCESVFSELESQAVEALDLPVPGCFRMRSHSYVRAIEKGCSQDDECVSLRSSSPPRTTTTVRTIQSSTGVIKLSSAVEVSSCITTYKKTPPPVPPRTTTKPFISITAQSSTESAQDAYMDGQGQRGDIISQSGLSNSTESLDSMKALTAAIEAANAQIHGPASQHMGSSTAPVSATTTTVTITTEDRKKDHLKKNRCLSIGIQVDDAEEPDKAGENKAPSKFQSVGVQVEEEKCFRRFTRSNSVTTAVQADLDFHDNLENSLESIEDNSCPGPMARQFSRDASTSTVSIQGSGNHYHACAADDDFDTDFDPSILPPPDPWIDSITEDPLEAVQRSVCHRDGHWFLKLLQAERDRMEGWCQQMEREERENSLPEDILGKIRTAVGSAQLLMAQKFYQFRELCEENLNPNARPRPTSQDLAGFWDMLQLSIENISMKFDELHQLKANNWKQMDPLDKKERRVPPPVPKKPAKGPAPLIRERSLESSQRQEARKRLMAAKRAASVRQNSATESAESIEIYIPEAQTRL